MLNQVMSERGSIAFDKGKYDLALDHLNEAIKYDPKNYKSYALRGDAHRMNGEYSEAIEDYKIYLQSVPLVGPGVSPTNANAQSSCCSDLQKKLNDLQGKAAQANANLRLAVLEELQKTEFLTGNFIDAAAVDQQRLTLMPGDASVIASLHVDRMRANQNDWAEFRQNTTTSKPDAWNRVVLSFLWLQTSSDDLLKKAASSNAEEQEKQICDADFYIAETSMASDRNKATSYFKKAEQDCPHGFYHGVAKREVGDSAG